jgi:hypothetical protein
MRISHSRWTFVYMLLAASFQVGGWCTIARCAPIEYKQTLTVILREDQVRGWPEGNEDYSRAFWDLANSADGTRIGFAVGCSIGNSYYRHLYTASSSGAGLTDLTAYLPAPVVSASSGFLQMNDDGSRLFFRHPWIGDATDFYYCDTGAPFCAKAVFPQPGFTLAVRGHDFRKPYSIDHLGDTLFFKHNAGWDESAKKTQQGIYSAAVGGTPAQVMHLDELPCTSECGNMNPLRFLGGSADGSTLLLSHDTWAAGPSVAMWMLKNGAAPVRIPDEQYDYVWSMQDLPNHIISEDGETALYQSWEDNVRKLFSVDLSSGAKTPVAETTDLNNFSYVTLSPDGTLARFRAMGFKTTRVDLATGQKRDTGAYWVPEYRCSYPGYTYSDITRSNRSYFMGGKCEGGEARVYRVDMATTTSNTAPGITRISFSAPGLYSDGIARVTVTATVADAQGLSTITAVRMHTLVDGLENPDWMGSSEPLHYDAVLYDDGTHGDTKAGDGMYTTDTLRTYNSSPFYSRYSLPYKIGIRIVAKDSDGNYGMADTKLTLTDTPYPTVTVEATDRRASEKGPNKGKLKVSRTGDPSEPLIVRYKVYGTATNGVDYKKLSGKIKIRAGASYGMVTVVPLDDTEVEGKETVNIRLVGKPAYIVGTASTAKVVIVDNDLQ